MSVIITFLLIERSLITEKLGEALTNLNSKHEFSQYVSAVIQYSGQESVTTRISLSIFLN